MEDAAGSGITRLLRAWGAGDQAALNQLAPLVQDELHRAAHRHIRNEAPGQTLQTTALVNEAFVRLLEGAKVDWKDRALFFAISAQTMRRILVAPARARHGKARRWAAASQCGRCAGWTTVAAPTSWCSWMRR